MKLTISQVVASVPKLIALTQNKGFSAKIAYNLAKTFKSAAEEAQNYDKVRIEKLEEFCEKEKDGTPKKEENGSYKLTPKRLKEFQAEIKTLLEQEVEIYCTPISISEIGHISGISVECFSVLDWLFVE